MSYPGEPTSFLLKRPVNADLVLRCVKFLFHRSILKLKLGILLTFADFLFSLRNEVDISLLLLSAINMLKDKPAGSFVIRNSSTFHGSFGLAVKVSQLPANVQSKGGTYQFINLLLQLATYRC